MVLSLFLHVRGHRDEVVLWLAKENLRSRFKVLLGVLIAYLDILSAVCVWIECIEGRSASTDELIGFLGHWFDRKETVKRSDADDVFTTYDLISDETAVVVGASFNLDWCEAVDSRNGHGRDKQIDEMFACLKVRNDLVSSFADAGERNMETSRAGNMGVLG